MRQQYSFYGILLYIASTVYVLFMATNELEADAWNGIFWIIQLFICVNAVAKSFLQESKERMLYFYAITSPTYFILSKLIFNGLLMLLMSAISIFLFFAFMGNPGIQAFSFAGLVLIGGFSLSMVFSFLSAIAAKAQQNAAIVAILGFPLIIPQLMLLMKISNALFSAENIIQWTDLALLLALDALVALLSVILYPFLWKD